MSKNETYVKPAVTRLGNVRDVTFESPDWQFSVDVPPPPPE